jgi:thiamine pyrophosphate-dependent acetolactate synthase large subunit-like protein
MMHIQELDTAARYGVDLCVLVLNDGALGAEVHKLNAAGHDGRLATYPSPDFAKIAEGMGGSGIRLEATKQLKTEMLSLAARRRPFVIDARVSPVVISDPYRRVHFGLESRAPRLPLLGSRI